MKKKEEVIRKAAAAARIAATKKLAEHVVPSSGKVKNLVEDMEHCLIKQMGVSAFPSFLEVPKDSGMVFDGQLFLIKGYSQEVCNIFSVFMHTIQRDGGVIFVCYPNADTTGDGLSDELHTGRGWSAQHDYVRQCHRSRVWGRNVAKVTSFLFKLI